MKPRNYSFFPSTFSLALGLLAMPVVSHAADSTWDGDTDGNWNTTGNWSTNALPNSSNATFNSNPANIAINLANAVPIFQLRFDTATVGNFTFSGSGFSASGSGANIRVEATVTNGPTLTWGNNWQTTTTARTAPGGFSVSTLAGSNANLVFNGNLATNASAAAPGLIQAIDFKLSNSAASGGTTVNGIISDSPVGTGLTTVTKTGGGQGILTLNGANTYSGPTVWNTDSGSIVLGNKSALGAGVVRIAGTNTTNSLSANTTLTGANAVANILSFNSATVGTATTTDAVLSLTQGSPTATLVSGTSPAVGDVFFSGVANGGNGFIPYFTRVEAVSGATITLSANAIATTAATAALTTTPYNASSTGVLTISGTNAIEFSGAQNLSSVYSNGTAATRTYQITNTADTTFSGALQQQNGTASLTKTGAGRLILSGTNAYTGTTTISAGTLRLAGGAAIADASAVTLANVAGAILDLNDSNETVASIAGGGGIGGSITLGSGTLSVSGSTSTTFSGIISGTGGFTRTGSSNNYTAQTLNGANTYSGTTTISNGFLNVGPNSILSATNGPLGNSTSAIILGDASTLTTLYNPGAGDGPNVVLLLAGTGATPFSITRDIDSSTTADVKGRTDLGFVGTGTGTLTVSSNWTLGSGALRQHGLYAGLATQTLDFTGIISGGNSAAGLRAGDWGQGVGVVRLSNAANSYTSQTYVSNGTLLIAGNAAAGSGVLGANANMSLGDFGGSASALTDGAYTVEKTITLRSIVSAANTWTLGGNTANDSSFTGNIVTSSLAFSPTLRLAQPAGGTVTFSGVIGANPNATNVTNIEKTGAGTVVLTNTNTYDGNTTVSDGTLQLDAPNLPDTSTLTIGTVALSSAVLNLPNAGTDTVAVLIIDGGAPLPNGLYDSTNTSGAITGPGKIQVGAGGSDYATWIDSFPSITGADKLSTADPDNDGLTNQQEYAFGLIPNSGSSVNPITAQLDKTTGLFGYTRRLPSLTGLVYTYRSSTTLSGWTAFTPDSTSTNSATPTETITVDVPNVLLTNQALFIRVLAQ